MIRELFYTICIAVFAIFFHIYGDELKPFETVEINSVFGKLRGKIGTTRSGRQIYKFESIPFAKAPIDHLRFEPPVKHGKWDGILDATKKTPRCAQVDFVLQKFLGVEDCLYLNVYTPTLNKNEMLPVMIFFFGGTFMFGSTEYYSPDYLLDADVILVTVNYRTNILGFLNTEDGVSTGNQGLKDQAMSISWVNEAIKDFGGNPNPDQITIFGNSAGGASVSHHILSNMSQGFGRGISQSGTALCQTFNNFPRKNAFRFGSLAGCPTGNSQELVQCLKLLSTEELMTVHYETLDFLHDKEALFVPSVEFTGDGVDQSKVFLGESPTKLLKEGRFQHIPWITGVTKDEGCFRAPLIVTDKLRLDQLNHNWTSSMERMLILYGNVEEITSKIRQEYFPENETLSNKSPEGEKRMITSEDLQNITNLISDRYFLSCIRDAAIYHSKHAPVYLYYFTKIPDLGHGYILESSRAMTFLPVDLRFAVVYIKFLIYHYLLGWKTDDYGSCHTDECQELFRMTPELNIPATSERFAFSQEMVKLWVSFAKNGKPDSFFGVEWTPVKNEEDVQYLEINENPKMIKEPFTSRANFWKSLNLLQN